MSWLELGNVHPLAVDIVLVNVTAINGNTLVSIIGAFVSETVATFQTINEFTSIIVITKQLNL